MASKAARRQITKEKPGTPSMHLFDEETRKSMPMPCKSMGIAPKELMASTTNVLPNSLAAWPIGAIGLSMPLVVSQCTTTTWVMAASAASAARTSAAAGGCDSAYLSVVRAIDCMAAILAIRSP